MRLKPKKTIEKKKKEKVLNTQALNGPITAWLFRKKMEIMEKEPPAVENINEEWRNIEKIIVTATEKALGTKCKPNNPKKIHIWNEEVMKAINRTREKRVANQEK